MLTLKHIGVAYQCIKDMKHRLSDKPKYSEMVLEYEDTLAVLDQVLKELYSLSQNQIYAQIGVRLKEPNMINGYTAPAPSSGESEP